MTNGHGRLWRVCWVFGLVATFAVATSRVADGDELIQGLLTAQRTASLQRQAAAQAPLADAKVTLGTWQVVGPFKDAAFGIGTASFATVFAPEADALAREGGKPDLTQVHEAKKFPGMLTTERKWSAHPEWTDGYFHWLPRGPAPSRNETVYLYRTITAAKAVTLRAQYRAQDYSAIWLNGKQVTSLNARRYPYPSGVSLSLAPGVNHLLVKNTSRFASHGFAFGVEGLTPVYTRQPAPRDKTVVAGMGVWPGDEPYASSADRGEVKPRLEAWREQRDGIVGPKVKPAGLAGRYAAATLKLMGLSPKQIALLPADVQARRELYHRICTYTEALHRLRDYRFTVEMVPMFEPPTSKMAELLDTNYPPTPNARAYAKRLAPVRAAAVKALALADAATPEACQAVIAASKQIERMWAESIRAAGPIVFVRCPAYGVNAIAPHISHGASPASICVFDPSKPDDAPRVIFEEPGATVYDIDVSYDARTILFSARRKGVAGGWHVYEIGVDGSGLKQITTGWSSNISPCLLPSGEIMFVSTRKNTWVQCQGKLASLLFVCNRDGTNVRCVSANIDSDHTPRVMNDGRVLFSRWDYGIEKNVFARHALWTMNPDGTRFRLFYGNTVEDPAAFWKGAPVPGRPEVACVLGPHHSYQAGMIGLAWDNLGTEAPRGEGAMWLTREYPAYGDRTFPNGWQDPEPVHEKLFLVSYGGDGQKRNRLYMLDERGNRRCVYEDETLGIWHPRLLRARKAPPVIPAMCDNPEFVYRDPIEANRRPDALFGTFMLQDVYEGISDHVKRGEAKTLIVMEQVQKSRAMAGGEAWGHTPIIGRGTVHVRRVIGTVPIEADGSAYFTAPALRNISFNVLDADGKMLMRMGSDIQVMPGERTSCVGCHENRQGGKTPVHRSRVALAAKREPSVPKMPNWGTNGIIDFPKVVQPVLDKYCAKCHTGSQPKGGVDLSNDKTRFFSVAYDNLVDRGMVHFTNVFALDHDGNSPKSLGSYVSKINTHIDTAKHCGKTIPLADRQRIYTWIDANVPYYGTYTYTRVRGIGARDSWEAKSTTWLKKDLWPVFEKRCMGCHKRTIHNPAWFTPQNGTVSSTLWTDRAITAHGFPNRYPMSGLIGPELRINLTRPTNSLLLTAPLSEKAGGLGLCRAKDGTKHIFADKTDSDYVAMLKALTIGAERLKTYPRVDMPHDEAAAQATNPPGGRAPRVSGRRDKKARTKNVRPIAGVPAGTVNLALGAKATSPDRHRSEGGSSGIGAAIDGNVGTYWDDADGGELYCLRVALSKPADVSAVSIVGWKQHDFSPRDFAIVCDGKVVATVADAKYTKNQLLVGFPPVRCSTLELRITGYYGGSPGVRELGIYNLPAKTGKARK